MTYYTVWQNRLVPRTKRRAFQRISRHRTHSVALDAAKKASLHISLPVYIHHGEDRSPDTLINIVDDGRVLKLDEDGDDA